MNKQGIAEKVFVVGIVTPKLRRFDAIDNLEELKSLVSSAGANLVGEELVEIKQFNPPTFLGSGKVQEIKNQIELEVEQIFNNLAVARKTIDVAKEQVKSAEASFKIIKKKYEEGISAQIEYLDAQTTLIDASVNEAIAEYDFYITYADFERIVALYEF